MKNAGFGEKEMIDKELFKLIGKNKKYIFIAVLLQVIGLIANVGITASICWAIYLAFTRSESVMYSYPAICALIGIIVRYIMTRLTGDMKDVLGRKVKKDLRERTYNKIVKLGVRSTDRMSMAGLTQVSMEGVEQLDLYYSSYLPQFFFAMIAPVILFAICVWIDWRTALVLLACVPLIPVSIVAVSKYAKKIFAKYWGKYTSMGDKFLDSVQGLKELKIFKADEAQHGKMNESAEEFRKITMKVLVMQLASTTIMDLVAYGGAGSGIALAIFGAAFWGLSPIYALFLCLVAVEFFLPLGIPRRNERRKRRKEDYIVTEHARSRMGDGRSERQNYRTERRYVLLRRRARRAEKREYDVPRKRYDRYRRRERLRKEYCRQYACRRVQTEKRKYHGWRRSA